MNQFNKWIKESQEETQAYLIEQANTDLSLISLFKPRQEEISKNMSEFLGGLK
jgi:hypothetical protein